MSIDETFVQEKELTGLAISGDINPLVALSVFPRED
jgi:hypothetical protein